MNYITSDKYEVFVHLISNMFEIQVLRNYITFFTDKEDVAASLKKLSRYETDKVVFYHGGLLQDDASQRSVEITGRF